MATGNKPMPRASRRLEATLSRWRGRYGSKGSRNGKQELENQRFSGGQDKLWNLGENEWEEELSIAACCLGQHFQA